MAKDCYLIPTADISLNHTCSSGSDGWAMIDEETSDDATTYITHTLTTTDSSLTSTFLLTGEIPYLKHGVVTAAKLIVRCYRATNLSGDTVVNGTATIDGISGNLTFNSGSWTTTTINLDANNFQVGQSYSKQLELTTSGNSGKNTLEARITQAIVQITYDADYTFTVSHRGDGGSEQVTSPVKLENTGKLLIYNTSPILKVLSNDIDVTQQIINFVPSGTFEVIETLDGASYGFAKSGNYWVSQNKGVSSSAAVCKVNFSTNSEYTLNVYVINYAQQGSDYGILSNLNQTLGTSNSADSSRKWIGNTAATNINSEQLITYDLPSGESFITIKFLKNNRTDQNNDTLQFRIELIPKYSEHYEYTVNDVDDDYDFIVYYELPYFKQNDSWNVGKKVFIKSGGHWIEQMKYSNIWNETVYYKYQFN